MGAMVLEEETVELTDNGYTLVLIARCRSPGPATTQTFLRGISCATCQDAHHEAPVEPPFAQLKEQSLAIPKVRNLEAETALIFGRSKVRWWSHFYRANLSVDIALPETSKDLS